jgi:hypothetical protein
VPLAVPVPVVFVFLNLKLQVGHQPLSELQY